MNSSDIDYVKVESNGDESCTLTIKTSFGAFVFMVLSDDVIEEEDAMTMSTHDGQTVVTS